MNTTVAELPMERDHLSVGKALALGLAAMQIGPALALAAGMVIAFAGASSVLAQLMAFACILCVGTAVNVHAQRVVATGSLMSYVGSALGQWGRALTATSLILGYVVSTAATSMAVVIFTTSVLINMGLSQAHSAPIECGSVVVVSIVIAAFAYRGIEASIRGSMLMGFLCVPVIAVAIVAAVANNPMRLSDYLPVNHWSVGQAMRGATIAMSNYVGFDGLATLAGETRNPKRNIPLLLSLVLIIMGGSLAIGALLQSPLLLLHPETIDAGVSPITLLAQLGGLGQLGLPLDVLLTLASLASCIAFANFGGRVVAAAAADGLLPVGLAGIHARYRSPYRAIVALSVVSAGLAIVLDLKLNASPLIVVSHLVNLTTMYWLIPYCLTCFSAVLVLIRERSTQRFSLLASAVGCLGVIYLLSEQFRSGESGLINLLPYIAIATIAVGTGWMVSTGKSGTSLDELGV